MIYFDTPTKIELTRKFARLLVPGGYLFVGHSESLNTLTNDFVPIVPAVYQKVGGR
jgi:chemotaxis protein methyltransferase CheR